MDEFGESNYYYNQNYLNNNYESYLIHSKKYNNYMNSSINDYNLNHHNNNINISQDSLSLLEIKKDLTSLNNKLNIISETLLNMNLFNKPSKKKINLKKSNSLNCKFINNRNAPFLYKQRYHINNSNFDNNADYSRNEIQNHKVNKKINGNYNEFLLKNANKNIALNNNYFGHSLNLSSAKNNKKIQNIKYSRNNSALRSKTNKFTFDETLNINTFKKNNKIINNSKNQYFGLYDQYFLENKPDHYMKKQENKNNIIKDNYQNVKDLIINQINSKINQFSHGSKKIIKYNNVNIKNSLNFSKYEDNNNDINKNRNISDLKKSTELILPQKKPIINKIQNYNNDNKNLNINENKQEEQLQNIIKEDEDKEQKCNIISSNNEKIFNIKNEEQNNQQKNFDIINLEEKIKKKENKCRKKIKNLSFHEEDNVTIEYNKKEEITKFDVFDFFGENQNFRPRNINVILEKLKRKKVKNNSILLNDTNKKNLKDDENQNKSKEKKKIKRANSGISITSNKEKMLLKKYKLIRRNSNSQNKKKNYTKQKNKICEKFRNNPQLFYSEEPCDLILKSIDIDGKYLKERNNKRIIHNQKKNITNYSNKRQNITDIDIDIEPFDYLQKIIEEIE